MPIIGPNALKRSFLSLSKRGVWRSVRLLLFDIIYEHRFGANTSVYIPSEKLDFSAEARSHAPNHFPARYLYLHEALSTGRVDCHDGVFVDYGSRGERFQFRRQHVEAFGLEHLGDRGAERLTRQRGGKAIRAHLMAEDFGQPARAIKRHAIMRCRDG